MAISVNPITKVIYVPQSYLGYLGGSSYTLDTDIFRLDLKSWEDSEEGMMYPDTHNHNTVVSLGGIDYARFIEMINGYTVTFEEGLYSVSLIGSNNNILDVTNLNSVAVRSNNSAGLVQMKEIQQSSYDSRVTIDVLAGSPGTIYPIGTLQRPVNNLADAKFIAALRGLDSFDIIGNLTIGATDNISNLHFYGQGATFNVKKTIVTLTSGCITTNASWHELMIQGVQGGEAHYHKCLIGSLSKAHCHYDACMMVGPVSFNSGVGSTHTTALVDCYTSTSEYVVDAYDVVTLQYSQLKQVYMNFIGKIKFINFQNSGSIINLNISSGEVTIDPSCTAGTFNIRGNTILTNNSAGAIVKTEGLVMENFTRIRHSIEALRPSHPGFGTVYYVDVINGRNTNDGLSYTTPLLTFTAAHSLAVSGRGDVIQFIAPGVGGSICTENLVITKEDIQVRGPGRGQDIKPTSGIGVHIQANNCSLSGFVVRAPDGSSSDCIVINGKFVRLENLYVVGADTGGSSPVGTGNGIHLKGGDYHKIINCEIEKCGGNGILFTDAPMSSEGSPREVLIERCNNYYNRDSGIKLTATNSNSTRLIYIDENRIQHNGEYGVYIGANSLRTIVRSTNWVKDNGTYPSGSPEDPTREVYVHPQAVDAMIDVMPDNMAKAIWSYINSAVNLSYETILLEIYRLAGLDPTKPLVVTDTSRDAGVEISQTITSNPTTTTVTRN